MEKRKEKRLRLKLQDSVKEDRIMINDKLAKELEITDKVEIVVGGKKKLVLNAMYSSDVPIDQAIINTIQGKVNGIADNTIATIRKA
ncbi:MAG TPA: hypothetical protein VKU94_03460 [Geobacterales bacterium]|nr:hypothetical protein [Geobacterales bacterium]